MVAGLAFRTCTAEGHLHFLTSAQIMQSGGRWPSRHCSFNGHDDSCPASRSEFRDRVWPRHLAPHVPAAPEKAAQARRSSRCISAVAAPPQGRAGDGHPCGRARLLGTRTTPGPECSQSRPTNHTGDRRSSVGIRPALPSRHLSGDCGTEFIPSGANVKGVRRVPASASCQAGALRSEVPRFAGFKRSLGKPSPQNRRRAIISGAAIP